MQPPSQTRLITRHLHRRAQVYPQARVLGQFLVPFDWDAGEPGQQAGEVEVGYCGADWAGGVDYREDFGADLPTCAQEGVRDMGLVWRVGGQDVDDYVFEDEVVDFDA